MVVAAAVALFAGARGVREWWDADLIRGVAFVLLVLLVIGVGGWGLVLLLGPEEAGAAASASLLFVVITLVRGDGVRASAVSGSKAM
jgi:hypothetical protein